MKSFFMSVLYTGMLLYAGAQDPVYPPAPAAPQNITAAEYFVDNDPGTGAATGIAVTPALNISNAAALINVNGLSTGVHKLVLRTKNNQGVWGISNIREFLYDFDPVYRAAPLAPQNITAAEYFIDTDPGFGSATAIPITPGVNITNAPVTVNTAALSVGVHRLYIRTKNNQGSWALCSINDFIVDFDFAYPASPASPQNFITAEYFIDTDPGFGSGTAFTVSAATDLNNVAVAVNTATLAVGSHRLFIRSKSAEGHWSLPAFKEFIVNLDPAYAVAPAAPQNIVAAEYFINTDPGAGNGTVIPLTAALDINNLAVSINTSSLSPATTNLLYLRTKNNEGRWSITNVKQFAVTITNDPAYPASPVAPQNIVGAEYFINTDPGVGNGTAIPVTAALDINNISVAVNTSSLAPATTNWLFVRTRNNEGRWSISNQRQFVVDITNDPVYPPAPVAAQNIVAAEYFINTDPGAGNGISIPVAAALDISNLPVVVNTSSLAPATTNHLFLRTKNTEGRWSITNSKQFVVNITNDPSYPNAPAAPFSITAAEYFIDTDPGMGSGTAISISAATNISNLAASINTNGLSGGTHDLFLRTKNLEGAWSITNRASFIVGLLSTSADSLVFGDVPLTSTLTKNLVITNNSAANQTINAVVTSLPFGSNFTVARTILPGQKDTIIVSFTPTAIQLYTGTITLQTSAGNYIVDLKGAGITQVAQWTLEPALGHNYGNVQSGTAANFSFIVRNTGNLPVTLSNVQSSDPAFVPTFTAGTTIAAGNTISLPVSFNPVAVNQYSASLKIKSSTTGVDSVTAPLSGNGFNPGAAPVLQFVSASPYNGNTGVNPPAGQQQDFTYKILYKSSNNRAPLSGSPKLSIDLNGDHDFTDLNEGIFTMVKESAGTDYVTGIVYTYTYTHLNNTSTAGYQFTATDDNGNAATTINTAYLSGPVVTDQQLDLRIFANDISFSKNNPLPGETFTVFARVSNNTALPATNIPVKFFRDSILIANDIIPAVNAFSNATISRTMSFGAEGFYPIKVWIDSSNTLADLNPLNNYAIRPVVVGSPNLPGGITVSTTASMQQCPQVKVFISGYASYYGTGTATAVAGAEVTINTGTQLITTTTNSSGYYSYLLTGVTCGSNFTYNVSITDFTFTSNLVTNSIALPCPAPGACVPAPSMGGAFISTSSSPCANVVGGTGTVTLRLQYRERNLANFWNGWDEIENDTLKIFRDGVLIETRVAADHSNAPGNVVNVPVNFPLTSTTPSVITAELKYVYVEYFQLPGAFYHGVRNLMVHTAGSTITPIDNKPDLTIQSFAQTSFTSFSFNDANIKCVAAGAHVVKIFDSIPGGTLTLIDTRNISSLAAGGAVSISYSDPAISSGIHFIRVITDVDGTVSETDETNNTFTFTIVVPPADLTITKLVTSPTNLSIGSTTRFTATVRNTGRRAGVFTIRFEAGGVQVGGLKTVTFLNENSTVQVQSDLYTVTNNSNSCGVLVKASADFGASVPESDETNNDRQITLGTDLAPYQLSGEVGSASNPATVRVFTTNQFYPAVRNIGERDASDITVRFTLNGNWIGSDTVGNVKAGEIFAAHASFSRMFTVAGNYVVKVTADTANTICENSEANNQGDFYIRVVDSKPDLEVLSQFISPSNLNPNIGQTVTLVGTVKNMGGNITTPGVLRFLVDDIQLGADVPINAILPGRDTTVAATATYSSIIPGVKIMKIVADPFNTMVEEREDNNEATRAMIVGDAPDMARSFAGAISFNPSGFVRGDSVNVSFTIKNLGPTDGTAWVKFFIKDTTYATTAVDSMPFSLASGATITVSKRMLFSIDEGYVTTEIYNSSPLEFDLLNNNDTLRFTTVAHMKQSITINGNLDMKQAAPLQLPEWIGGKIMLGNYDLTVNGIILNYDSAHFIISNGTGKLRLVNSNAQNIFPVGTDDSSINFVRINNAGTPDNFSVRVAPYVLANGNSGDTTTLANVDRTWFITEDLPGGSNVTAEFWWSTNSELPGFDRLLCYTAHYTNLWEYGTTGAAVLATNGQYSRIQTGFTSFSPFTVTSGIGVVPVQLVSFTAQNKTISVLLNWKTENELNLSGFEVQRSEDGIHFSGIGRVAAYNTPGTHQYNLTDGLPLKGISYYRLKQVDLNGSFVYSNIIAINRNSSENSITVFPNPVKDLVTVVFTASDQQRKMLITDAGGAVVKTIIVPAGATNVKTDMSVFARGFYSIILYNGEAKLVRAIIKQ